MHHRLWLKPVSWSECFSQSHTFWICCRHPCLLSSLSGKIVRKSSFVVECLLSEWNQSAGLYPSCLLIHQTAVKNIHSLISQCICWDNNSTLLATVEAPSGMLLMAVVISSLFIKSLNKVGVCSNRRSLLHNFAIDEWLFMFHQQMAIVKGCPCAGLAFSHRFQKE